MNVSRAATPSSLYRPQHWPSWLVLGLMRILCMLPVGAQLVLGRAVGRLAFLVMKPRRLIAQKNVALCFPELDAQQQAELIKNHFRSLGIGLFETAMTWWAPREKLAPLSEVHGLEYLEQALAQGNGAILLSAHFTTLEIGCRLLLLRIPFHPMYRHYRNPVFTDVMRHSRERLAETAIHKDDVRTLLRSLKANHAVWYAPDQAHRGKNSAMVPFFSIPAPTNLATSRLSKATGAPVIPFFQYRKADDSGYVLELQPALENFPGNDPVEDAQRINEMIESWVRKAPAQYLWIHRRFKGTGVDYPSD